MPVQRANNFHLSDSGITIDYSATPTSGRRTLTYAEGHEPQSFQENDITVQETAAGNLISVTITKTVDRGYTSFSFLLPDVQVNGVGTHETFQTVGIKADHKTSLVLPGTGARTSYRVYNLHGTARLVESMKAQG